MIIFYFILPLSLYFHPPVFVSDALESSRGSHKTGTEENISKHRDKEETERGSLIFHTGSRRLHAPCAFVESHVRLHVCVCAPGHRQILQVRDTCSGLLADDKAVVCSDLHARQMELFSCVPVVWTLAHILHVASAVSGLCDIYFVWGRVNQCYSLKAEHLCHGGVIA